MAKVKSKRKLVLAIEVGNLHSGYSFGERSDESWMIYTAGDNKSTQTDRVSTSLLLTDDLSFDSFGENAKEKFMYLTLKNEHENYVFIDNLHIHCDKKNNSYIYDFQGTLIPAEHIYMNIINHLLEQCNNHIAKYKNYRRSEKYLILVVPSDVSKELKDIMKTNIKGVSSICFVSSSEAGSEYCLHQNIFLDESTKTEQMQSNAQYMVVNFGKDTTTVCYQKILAEDNLKKIEEKEVKCGGNVVTDSFLEDVKTHYGMMKTWDEFKRDNFYDYMYIRRTFDDKKHKFNSSTENVMMEMPASVIDLGKENKNRSLVFREIKYKIIISQETMRKYFRKSLDNVISKIQNMCNDTEGNDSIVLLLGGLSESSFVRDNIKEGVSPKSVILVPKPSLAVLKGAVMLGLQKKANETYGFISLSTPENTKNFFPIEFEGKEMFFIRIIDKNQNVKDDDSFEYDLKFHVNERDKPIVFYHSSPLHSDFEKAIELKPTKQWGERENIKVKVSIQGYNVFYILSVIPEEDKTDNVYIDKLFEFE